MTVSHTFFKQMRLLDMKARKSSERESEREATAATVLSNNSFFSHRFASTIHHISFIALSHLRTTFKHYSIAFYMCGRYGGLAIANEQVSRAYD